MQVYFWGLALLLTFHFPIALPLPNNLFVPLFPLVFFVPLAMWRRPNYAIVGVTVLSAMAFVLVTILYSDLMIVDFWRRLRSGGQLCYILSITAMIATCRPFNEEEAAKLGKFLMYVAGIIVVMGVLEILTPFRLISDGFRANFYSDTLNYQDDMRDYSLAGYVRPKVFTSEPSHAAWSLCQLVLCALAIVPSRRTMLGAIVILGVGTLVFASPTIPITCVAMIIIAAVPHWGVKKLSMKGVLWGGMILCAFALGAFLAYDLFSERFHIYTGTDDSIYLRILQPFGLAYTALEFNPMLGVGFGGLESIWNEIKLIEGGSSAQNLNQTPGMALLTIPLYSGLLGSALFSGIMLWIIQRNPRRVGVQLIFVLLFTMLQKSSFVITTAWLVTAVWLLQAQRVSHNSSLKRGFDMWTVRPPITAKSDWLKARSNTRSS